MPTESLGKKFEGRFREDWKATFPDSFILRIPDQMSGYKVTSQNICDYICYTGGLLFLIELKTHKGASIPIANIVQYERMKPFIGTTGVRVGVVVWLYDKDAVMYIPCETISKVISDGEKSIGLRNISDYNIKIVPSEKRRFFMNSDYSFMTGLQEGE